MRILTLLAAWVLFSSGGIAQDQAGDPRLAKLPAVLRDSGQAVLGETDEGKRAALVVQLIRKDTAGALQFVLGVLEEDPSARVRHLIVDRVGGFDHARVRRALERRVSGDPDIGVAILALEKLRSQRLQPVRQLLERRLQTARENGNTEDLRLLAVEHDRWISLSRGAALPAFLREPPPLFSVKPADQPVRVLAFGDYGQGTAAQRQVAAAMLRFHRNDPVDFAITLGDNFYGRGMESPSDPRWKTLWDELYDPLGIRIYASLGNHDWGLPDSPAAEVLYTQKSPSWRMPATRYTFTAGAAQFFAIDTAGMSEAQLLWLKEELSRSQAVWKIVYGHHPVYSHGAHGDTPGLIRDLLPVLDGRADLYLAGHEHDLQHLKPHGKLHFFISGGGGAGIRPITPGPRSLFAKSSYGFAVLEAGTKDLRVTFLDSNLQSLYQYSLSR